MSLVPNETQQALNAQREAFVASIEVSRQKINEQADRIAQLEAALEVCDRVLHFDLRKMITWGPDYNQAVKDAANVTRAALGGET